MSLAMLKSALLLPLEMAVNSLLAFDTASRPRLAKLAGKTLAVHVTQPPASVFVAVRADGLHLATIHEGPETASLHGSTPSLLGLLLRREHVDSLHTRGVELRGDTAFVQQLQAVLLDLDIDWEYQLSRVIGDIPTQAASDGLREADAQLRKAGSRLRENVSEYLHEESGLLAGTDLLESFYQEIAELKLRADRLQARFDRFSSSNR